MKTKTFENVTAKVFDWIIPYFGNNHYCPYGTLLVKGVVNGEVRKSYCKTKGDMIGDKLPQYIIFEGQRFKVYNDGSMYSPKIRIEIWNKTKVDKKWMYL